jgi:hypothetical protein
VDGPILVPAVIPPPGGLHSLRLHAELIEQQQQALAAAGTAAGAGVGFELFHGPLKELHDLGPLLLVEWLLVTRPCWAPARRLALIRASRISR